LTYIYVGYRFNGSAGTAIIPSTSTSESAILFADSRYWVQADKQIPKSGWKVFRVGANGGSGPAAVAGSWSEWLIQVRFSTPFFDLADTVD